MGWYTVAVERLSVRIAELRLRSFRNVIGGSFRMPSAIKGGSPSADILGIYGQNGSGKTAAIEALGVVQSIIAGRSLPGESREYINIDSSEAAISISFTIEDEERSPVLGIRYGITIGDSRGQAVIRSESLWSRHPGGRERLLASFTRGESLIRPERMMREIVCGSSSRRIDLLVAMKMAEKEDVSAFFSDDGGYEIFSSLGGSAARDELSLAVSTLRGYAETSLIVLSTDDSTLHADRKLPITYQVRRGGRIARGSMLLDISRSFTISKEAAGFLSKLIDSMNIVLGSIVPRLRIGIFIRGDAITETGGKGVEAELVSYKNGTPIPLRFESVGIIKIISMLSVLLAVYNSRSVCLVIDEFDSSIFEYLLGEMISIFRDGAEGQLIFTSHNLRILEMVGRECIVFSTLDPQNRFTRIRGGSGNLRDEYIRALLLGGAKDISGTSDSHDISRAFRMAWRSGDEE